MTRASTTASNVTTAELHGCIEACRRCEALLEHLQRLPASEARSLYDAIGPHLRHCVDHWHCLLEGLGGAPVDYDARARDPRLEREPQRMRDALAEVSERLAAIPLDRLGDVVTVRQTAASGHPPVDTPSTLARELVFLSGHTIHHLAVIRLLGMRRGIELPTDLDLAFSTAAHRARRGIEGG